MSPPHRKELRERGRSSAAAIICSRIDLPELVPSLLFPPIWGYTREAAIRPNKHSGPTNAPLTGYLHLNALRLHSPALSFPIGQISADNPAFPCKEPSNGGKDRLFTHWRRHFIQLGSRCNNRSYCAPRFRTLSRYFRTRRRLKIDPRKAGTKTDTKGL